MKINTNTRRAIKLNNSEIEETDEFVYLGSKITTDGDSTTESQKQDQHLPVSATFGNKHQSYNHHKDQNTQK
jgi:hypothetical protein